MGRKRKFSKLLLFAAMLSTIGAGVLGSVPLPVKAAEEEGTYTVRFEAYEGTCETESVSVPRGESIVLPGASYEGHYLESWMDVTESGNVHTFKAVGAAGSEYTPEMVTVESQHSYTQKLARSAADFFSRRLLEKPADFSSFCFSPLPDSALWCTSGGILPKEYPQMRTLHQELVDESETCRKERAALFPGEVEDGLSQRLHLDRILPEDRMVRRVYHETPVQNTL